MYYDTNKATITNKCTLFAGRFDGHGSAPEQYRWHCPMRHVQGYSGRHWTLPSGNYSLSIAPSAAKATANKTMTKNVPKTLAILMVVGVHRYNTTRTPQ
jgi:hypothetical protein